MSRRGSDPRGRGTSAWVTAIRERVFQSPAEKLLMMTLADYIDGDDECWPGNARLAPEVGVEQRTIRRCLARLEDVGVVERLRRPRREDGRGRLTDVIRFLWDGFQNLPLVHPDPPDQADKMSPRSDPTKRTSRDDQADIHDPTKRTFMTAPSIRTPSVEPPQRTNPPNPPAPAELVLMSAPPREPLGFDEFWDIYPRKAGKVDARKAWTTATKATSSALIIAGALRFRDDPNREAGFTKHPATWLRSGCWDDDPIPSRLRSTQRSPSRHQANLAVIEQVGEIHRRNQQDALQ